MTIDNAPSSRTATTAPAESTCPFAAWWPPLIGAAVGLARRLAILIEGLVCAVRIGPLFALLGAVAGVVMPPRPGAMKTRHASAA